MSMGAVSSDSVEIAPGLATFPLVKVAISKSYIDAQEKFYERFERNEISVDGRLIKPIKCISKTFYSTVWVASHGENRVVIKIHIANIDEMTFKGTLALSSSRKGGEALAINLKDFNCNYILAPTALIIGDSEDPERFETVDKLPEASDTKLILASIFPYEEGSSNIEKYYNKLRDESLGYRLLFIRKFLADCFVGIACLHGNGCAHRDLKSSNVLIGKDLTLRIIDFGMLVKKGETGSVNSFTGTKGYEPYSSEEDICANFGAFNSLVKSEYICYYIYK